MESHAHPLRTLREILSWLLHPAYCSYSQREDDNHRPRHTIDYDACGTVFVLQEIVNKLIHQNRLLVVFFSGGTGNSRSLCMAASFG